MKHMPVLQDLSFPRCSLCIYPSLPPSTQVAKNDTIPSRPRSEVQLKRSLSSKKRPPHTSGLSPRTLRGAGRARRLDRGRWPSRHPRIPLRSSFRWLIVNSSLAFASVACVGPRDDCGMEEFHTIHANAAPIVPGLEARPASARREANNVPNMSRSNATATATALNPTHPLPADRSHPGKRDSSWSGRVDLSTRSAASATANLTQGRARA